MVVQDKVVGDVHAEDFYLGSDASAQLLKLLSADAMDFVHPGFHVDRTFLDAHGFDDFNGEGSQVGGFELVRAEVKLPSL